MSVWQVTLLVVCVLVFDACFVTLLVRTLVAGMWRPLADDFPPVEPEAHAERRRFQSYRMGIFNLGFCVHTAADRSRLHLTPIRILQRLGMRPMSLPWSAMTLRPKGRFGRMRTVGLGTGWELSGPAWALERASG